MTKEDIRDAIDELNATSSPGPDGVRTSCNDKKVQRFFD